MEEGPQISEFVVSVSAVLETTGVDHSIKARVMGVVSRLVDRLHRVEEEKDSANLQLKGKTFGLIHQIGTPSISISAIVLSL